MKKIIPRLIGFYLNVLVWFTPKFVGKKSILLFSRPQRPAIKQNHLDFFNSSEKFSFDVNGEAIQSYKWGTGDKVLVFFHGWQSHSFRWKNYIEAFSKKEYTIYAMDAPGMGFQQAGIATFRSIAIVIGKISEANSACSHNYQSFIGKHVNIVHIL